MDGQVDPTFSLVGSGFNGAVYSLALQPDGKVVAGGLFTSYNDGTTTYTCNHVARINADGTFDTGFVNGSDTGFRSFSDVIFGAVLQPNGQIIVGGGFTSYKDHTGTYSCRKIARLNADGTFDTGFVNGSDTGFSGSVYALALQPNGQIIAGGNLSSYKDQTGTYSCRRIARLNIDGTFDTGFVHGATFGFTSGEILVLTLQPDGKIIVGGIFPTYEDPTGTYLCNSIARLNIDGTFDTGFVNGTDKSFNGIVRSLVLQPNDQIIVGGDFSSYKDQTGTYLCNNIARLNIDGTFDTGFVNGTDKGFGNIVYALALQPNGKIIVGGNFVVYNDGTDHHCKRIARLEADGNFDIEFVNGPSNGFDQYAYTFALQPNGRLIVGGGFSSYNDGSEYPCGKIIRLLAYKIIKTPLFVGENFGASKAVKVNAAKAGTSLTTPVSSKPGMTPGAICVSPGGNFLIRKPDGSVGVIS